jgi:putative transposase
MVGGGARMKWTVHFEDTPLAIPSHLRKAETSLKKCQRRVSRRHTGSHRRRKAVALLAKAHQDVRRAATTGLPPQGGVGSFLKANDTMYLEDVPVRTLVRNLHLAKRIRDAGWAQFRTIREGKAVYAGRQVIAVNPASTTQECRACGSRIAKSLSVRIHVCPTRGLS